MMTIQENQEKIKNIYKDINQAHGHDHDFFFGYLTRTIASGFKKIHKGFDPSEKFSKSIAYLFGLCELSGIDLESSFLKRFPNCCPYCLASPCECYLTNKKSSLNIPQRKYAEELEWKYLHFQQNLKNDESIVDFDYVANFIHKIYPLNKIYWDLFHGPEYHILKCFEELGEIQEAYSIYLSKDDSRKSDYLNQFQDEICDLFAWLISAWKLQCPNLNITEFFEKMYNGNCPSCNQEHCICKNRNNSSDMLWRKEEIENIYVTLTKITSNDPRLPHLLKLYDDALLSNSHSEFKRCLKETIAFLSNSKFSLADKYVDDLNRQIQLITEKI